MSKIRVGVMRGGAGYEYDISLKTGANVLKHISREKYEPVDVLISKDGTLHMSGYPSSLEKLAGHIDVVFNALHGEFGEDGKIQQLLGNFSITHTGSEAVASAVGMNKELSKSHFNQSGINTPVYAVVRKGDNILQSALEIFRKIPPPFVVKPLASGSSVGVALAKTIDSLVTAIEFALMYTPSVIVEEYIKGKEITCGVVDSMEHNISHAMQPVQVVLPEDENIYSYSLKYGNNTVKKHPADISPAEKDIIQALAVRAHRGIGMRHYSQSDFIISPSGIYILETNSLPGLTDTSLLPFSLQASEITLEEFIDHILTLALEKK